MKNAYSKNLSVFGSMAAMVTSVVILFLWLQTVPGIHGDEAWRGTIASQILQGYRPVQGLSSYTGAMSQYCQAVFIGLLGPSVWALRLGSSLSNLLALFILLLLLRKVFNQRIAILTVALIACSPIFALYAQVGTEFSIFNLLPATLALYLFSKNKPILDGIAGFALAFGMGNHLIFTAFVIAVGVLALLNRTPFKRRILSLGGFVGFCPTKLCRKFCLCDFTRL